MHDGSWAFATPSILPNRKANIIQPPMAPLSLVATSQGENKKALQWHHHPTTIVVNAPAAITYMIYSGR